MLVAEQLNHAVAAASRRDAAAAREVLERKSWVNDLVERALRHQAERLVAEAPDRIAAYRLETDVIEVLKRVYYHAKRIAKTVVEEASPAGAQGSVAPAEPPR